MDDILTALNQKVVEYINQDTDARSIVVWLICAALILCAAGFKFAQPVYDREIARPVTLLPFSRIYLKHQYNRAMVMYMLSMLILYLLVTAVGPPLLGAVEGVGPAEGPIVPVLAFLVLMGVNSDVPYARMVEQRTRSFWHARAFIPAGVEKAADRLLFVPVQWDMDVREDGALQELMKLIDDADWDAPVESAEAMWARGVYLWAQVIRDRRSGGRIGSEFYADTEEFRSTIDDLRGEIAEALKRSRRNRPRRGTGDGNGITSIADEDIRRKVERHLRAVLTYIVCGLRVTDGSEQLLQQELSTWGILPEGTETPASGNGVLYAVLCAGAGIFIVSLSLKNLLPQLNMGASADSVEALKYAFSGMLLHGFAASVALRSRARQIHSVRWKPTPRSYARVALTGAFGGWLAYLLFQFAVAEPGVLTNLAALWSTDALLDDPVRNSSAVQHILQHLPWVIPGFVTSWLAVCYLRVGVVEEDGRRGREAAVGGAACAASVCLAMLLQTDIIGRLGAPNGLDVSGALVAGINGMVVGAVFGWLIPFSYRRQVRDPEDFADAARSGRLQARVREVLIEPSAVRQWMLTPTATTHALAPAEAVNYEGYYTTELTSMLSQLRQQRLGRAASSVTPLTSHAKSAG